MRTVATSTTCQEAKPEHTHPTFHNLLYPNQSTPNIAYKILVLLLFIGISVPLAFFLNAKVDEVYALNTSSGSFAHTWQQALTFELQVPLYFLVLNVWGQLSEGLFFARLLSILSVCGAIYFVFELSKELLPRTHSVWISVLFAFNPFTIYLATDARSYAFCLFIGMAMTYYLYKGFFSDQVKHRHRILYSILACIAIASHYYMGLLFAIHGFMVLFSTPKRSLLHFMYCMIAPSVVLAAFVPFLYSHFSAHSGFEHPGTEQLSPLSGYLYWLLKTPEKLIFPLLALLFLFIRDKSWSAFLPPMILVLYLGSLVIHYRPMVKHYDYKGISAYIEKKEVPGQAILVYPNYHKEVFEMYYKGTNPLIALPRKLNYEKAWEIRAFRVNHSSEMETFDHSNLDKIDSFWLIEPVKDKVLGIGLNKEIIHTALSKNFQSEETKIIHKNMLVRRFTRQRIK